MQDFYYILCAKKC
jgi:hypothetical protein